MEMPDLKVQKQRNKHTQIAVIELGFMLCLSYDWNTNTNEAINSVAADWQGMTYCQVDDTPADVLWTLLFLLCK